MRPKKGDLLKSKTKKWSWLVSRMEVAVYKKDQEAIDKLNEIKNEDQIEYDKYMATLPTRFSKSYSIIDYKNDQRNVDWHYTMWVREDIYLAKASLRRCKQYRKREGINEA